MNSQTARSSYWQWFDAVIEEGGLEDPEFYQLVNFLDKHVDIAVRQHQFTSKEQETLAVGLYHLLDRPFGRGTGQMVVTQAKAVVQTILEDRVANRTHLRLVQNNP